MFVCFLDSICFPESKSYVYTITNTSETSHTLSWNEESCKTPCYSESCNIRIVAPENFSLVLHFPLVNMYFKPVSNHLHFFYTDHLIVTCSQIEIKTFGVHPLAPIWCLGNYSTIAIHASNKNFLDVNNYNGIYSSQFFNTFQSELYFLVNSSCLAIFVNFSKNNGYSHILLDICLSFVCIVTKFSTLFKYLITTLL